MICLNAVLTLIFWYMSNLTKLNTLIIYLMLKCVIVHTSELCSSLEYNHFIPFNDDISLEIL